MVQAMKMKKLHMLQMLGTRKKAKAQRQLESIDELASQQFEATPLTEQDAEQPASADR